MTPTPRNLLAERGILPGRNAPIVLQPSDARAESPRSQMRSDLVDRLPDLLTISGGLELVASPKAINSTPLGTPILNILPDTYGQELWLNGISLDQLPCDADGLLTDPNSGFTMQAWGDRFGRRASVMIGIDLYDPSSPSFNDSGLWWPVACNDPSFGYDPGTWDVISALTPSINAENAGVLWRKGFPPGKATDTNVFRRVLSKGFGALGARVGLGHRLQAMLVVAPNTFDTNLKYLACHVDIELNFAPTRSPRQFSENAP